MRFRLNAKRQYSLVVSNLWTTTETLFPLYVSSSKNFSKYKIKKINKSTGLIVYNSYLFRQSNDLIIIINCKSNEWLIKGFYFASTISNSRLEAINFHYWHIITSKDLMTHLKRCCINWKFSLPQNTNIALHSTKTAKANCEGLPLFLEKMSSALILENHLQ